MQAAAPAEAEGAAPAPTPSHADSSAQGIPDKVLIQLAKDRRQKAREASEFIPLDDNAKPTRLVPTRTSIDTQPLSFGDAARQTNRQANRRQVAVALERDLDPGDEEFKLLEQQLIQSGGSTAQAPAAQAWKNPQRLAQAPLGADGYGGSPAVPQARKRDYKDPENVAHVLFTNLKQTLDEMQGSQRRDQQHLDRIEDDLKDAQTSEPALQAALREASTDYTFFQETKGYTTDLLNCLDVKIPLVEDCEARVHVLWKERADGLVARRQLDYADALLVMTGDPRKRKAGEEDTQRERRMLNKRHRREKMIAQATPHAAQQQAQQAQQQNPVGEATDDDESPADVEKRRFSQAQIILESKDILSDVVDDFAGVKQVAGKFQDWKFNFGKSYGETFAGESLRKILTPLVKLQLLEWNPLEGKGGELVEMPWFQDLEEYGLRQDEEADDSDPDQLKLVQDMVELAVLPKLTGIAEHVWDPLSSSQSALLQEQIRDLIDNFSHAVTTQRQATQVLFTKVVKRIRRLATEFAELAAFGPLSVAQAQSTFVQQALVDELKFVKTVLSWAGLIKESTLQGIVLGHVVGRVLATIRSLPPAAKVDRIAQVVRAMPRAWFHGTTAAEKKASVEAQLAIMPLVDEVLNFKLGCEQARTLLPATRARLDGVVAALGTPQ